MSPEMSLRTPRRRGRSTPRANVPVPTPRAAPREARGAQESRRAMSNDSALIVVIFFMALQGWSLLVQWVSDAVLGGCEEWLKSCIRESAGMFVRFANSVSSALLSIASRQYYRRRPKVSKITETPRNPWWSEAQQSTLNAVLRRDRAPPSQTTRRSAERPRGSDPTVAGFEGHADANGTAHSASGRHSGRLSRGVHRSVTWLTSLVRRGPAHQSSPDLAAGAPSDGEDDPPPQKLTRVGSEMFDRTPGLAGMELGVQRLGMVDEARLACEYVVTHVFAALRWLVRVVTFSRPIAAEDSSDARIAGRGGAGGAEPHSAAGSGHGGGGQLESLELTTPAVQHRLQGRRLLHEPGGDLQAGFGRRTSFDTGLRRTNSFSKVQDIQEMSGVDQADMHSSARQFILQAGYPYECREVVTEDGYILRLERIPRPTSRSAVVFLHGILDTAIGWVASGALSSQAFNAFDQGFDVWLINSRSNPPWRNCLPWKQGREYWAYSLNELGALDAAAHIDRIHAVKCAELGVLDVDDVRRYSQRLSMNVDATARAATLQGYSELAAWRTEPETPRASEGELTSQGTPAATPWAWLRTPLRYAQQTPASQLGERVSYGGGPVRAESRDAATLKRERSARMHARRASLPSPGVQPPARPRLGEFPPAEPHVLRRHPHSSQELAASPAPSREEDGPGEDSPGPRGGRPPYTLQAVAHSLGGGVALLYLCTRLRQGAPHRLSRLVLLSPAGFHSYLPISLRVLSKPVRVIGNLYARFAGAPLSAGLHIPGFWPRLFAFKLAADLQRIPALGELARVAMGGGILGDDSDWDKSLLLPHYSAASMPAVSVSTLQHLGQLAGSRRFQLFDYGRAGNLAAYGQEAPPEVPDSYHLIDVPVDLIGGSRDGVIKPENVKQHYYAMRKHDKQVTFREFDYAHLDFTFGVKSDVRHYVSSRLALSKWRA
ncbi:unnamed protein product [Pedinophyceae sp. YPF-701]|nr:unnamed protein product [Pedinophyceae sp. YPF-701]